MSLLPDYARQAETYDQTRSASGPILATLQAATAGAPGNRLADIGGGTGNYALALEHKGWQPVVIELEAVAPADSDLDHEHRLIAELRDALGITDERLIALGYAAQLLRASGDPGAS